MSHRLAITFLLLLFAGRASALIMGGRTTEPVKDDNWPDGAVDVANAKGRVGHIEGPPFGTGQHIFYYQGDAAALQESLDRFAKVRAPGLRLIVHSGTYDSPFLRDSNNPGAADAHVDWEFAVWTPKGWYDLYDNPKYVHMGDANTHQPLPPPTIDVYVGGKIDWTKVEVPANVAVTDERADANGVDGPAARGDIYDYFTSKPVPYARVTLEKLVAQGQYELVKEGESANNGSFEVIGFAPGAMRVCVSADGYAPRKLEYARFDANSLKRYTVYLSPAASVSGTIVDTDGKPIPRSGVRTLSTLGPDGLTYQMPEETQKADADDEGRFAITGLPRGFATFIPGGGSYYPLNMEKAFAVPSDNIILRMTAVGRIHGRMPGSKPKTIFVAVDGDNGTAGPGSMQVQADGSFNSDRVPPGKYLLSTDARILMDHKAEGAKKIEVKAGETTEVDWTP